MMITKHIAWGPFLISKHWVTFRCMTIYCVRSIFDMTDCVISHFAVIIWWSRNKLRVAHFRYHRLRGLSLRVLINNVEVFEIINRAKYWCMWYRNIEVINIWRIERSFIAWSPCVVVEHRCIWNHNIEAFKSRRIELLSDWKESVGKVHMEREHCD